MAFDSASRYQLTDTAAMPPAKDIITGAVDGPFVDTGYDIPFSLTGRLYLSVATVRELAQGIGMVDEEDVESTAEAALIGHTIGYREGVNVNGSLVDAADRIGAALASLRDSNPLAQSPEPANGDENAEPVGKPGPTARVDDEGSSPGVGEGKPARTKGSRRVSGQSNGARRNGRPSGLPVSSSDGEPEYRL